MQCFRCGHQLEKSLFKRRIHYFCPACRTRMISIAALRNLEAVKGMVSNLWQASEIYSGEDGSVCRMCGRKLRQIKVQPDNAEKFEIDICRHCQVFWFDEGELEKLPLCNETANVPKFTPDKSIDMSKPMDLPDDMPPVRGDDESFSEFLLAAMGMPIAKEHGVLTRIPWVTTGIILLCTAMLIMEGCCGFSSFISEWGFIPDEPFRRNGLTILASAFMHASFYHFMSNIYFLWLSGKILEQELSWKKLILLFFLSLFCSKTFYLFTAAHMNIPCVGASGFISGFMGCCAVMFPSYRLSFLCRNLHWKSEPVWFELPFWFIFAVWFILQIVMVFFQAFHNVAFTSHIGGGIAGMVCGAFFRYGHLFKKTVHTPGTVDEFYRN